MKLSTTFYLLIVIFTSNALCAQSDWQPMNGPLGSYITTALITPDGTIYAGTLMHGLLKSTNNGASWISLEDSLDAQRISLLALDSAGNIYANSMQGLYKYNNSEWTRIRGAVKSIGVHPNGYIYIGIKYDTGLKKSTDEGQTWQDCNVGTGTKEIVSIFFAENGDIYAGSRGMPVMGESYFMSDVYRSTDYGNTWEMICVLKGIEISSIAANGSGTVLAGSGFGLFSSSAPFTEWETIENDAGDPLSITVDDEDNFIVVFSDYYSYKSSDNGMNWDLMSDERLFGFKGELIKDSEGNLYAVCFGDGLKRYYPNTKKWKIFGSPTSRLTVLSIDTDNVTIIAGTNNAGIHISSDGGSTWKASSTQFEPYFGRIYCAPSGKYYASAYFTGLTNSNCYYSDNKGESWTIIDFFEDNKVTDFLELQSGKMLISSENGLYISDDSENWELISDGLEDRLISCFAKQTGSILFAGTTDNGLLRSTDKGNTWKSINSPVVDSMNIRSIAADSEGNVIAGPLYGGVYVSHDEGTNWQKITNGFDGEFPQVIEFDDSGNAFILDSYKGLFKSADKGNSWELFRANSGSQEVAITGAMYDNGNKFLASLAYQGGIFSTDLSPNSVIDSHESLDFNLYPNPAVDHLEISISSLNPGILDLQIYDITGNQIKTINSKINRGSNDLAININDLSTGSYYAVININGRFILSKYFVKINN